MRESEYCVLSNSVLRSKKSCETHQRYLTAWVSRKHLNPPKPGSTRADNQGELMFDLARAPERRMPP
jgi:hypothetical protein